MRARWIVLLAMSPMLVPAPSSALSCVPLSEQDPHSSFAGTVVKQYGDAYLVVVREVWHGPRLNERTWVAFEQLSPDPAPAIGEPWVIQTDAAGRANTCTVTPDDDSANDLRPAKVRSPAPVTWWSALRRRLIGTTLLVQVPDSLP